MMKVGDLVYLNPQYFHEYDEQIGIIVKIDDNTVPPMIRVVWMDGNDDLLPADELELIDEK
jgi:hypothetical protein